MTIDSSIYPTVYGASLATESTSRVEWSYPIPYLNYIGNLPFEEPWDGSNSYIGFDPTLKQNYVGTAKHMIMQIDPENITRASFYNKQYEKRINYRMVMYGHTSVLTNAPLNAPYPAAWTNLKEPWAESFTTENQRIYFESALTGTRGYADIAGTTASNSNSLYKSYRGCPITSINKDAIILTPTFLIAHVTPTYNENGDIISISQTTNFVSYSTIKPQDKTDAGADYSDSLWEKGYKDTIDPDTGRITKRDVLRGARISNVYYGVKKHVQLTVRPSNTNWTNVSAGIPAYNGFAIVAEYYDEDRDAVIYEYPNGVWFGASQNFIDSVNTPWTTISNGSFSGGGANLNPNDNAFWTASTSFTGLTCDNDVNNLDKSFKLVLGSNRISTVNTGERFSDEIQTRYYFEDDGTISIYDTSKSGNNIIQGFTGRACFPLKDIMATIASFGLFFDAGISLNNIDLSDPSTYTNGLYRGNFDENGISDGTWWQGDEIPAINLNDVDYEPIVPKPDPVGPTTDEDEGDIPFNTNIPAGVSGFITQYVLTAGQVQNVGNSLWRALSDNTAGMKNNFYLIQNAETGQPQASYELSLANVIDYFISLKYFPFDLSNVSTLAPQQGIFVGAGTQVIDSATTPLVPNSQIVILDGGTAVVPDLYGSFLSHEPNVSCSIYIPYCGSVELQPSLVSGSTLGLKYCVDLVTGSVQAIITKSGQGANFPVATANGACGFEIMMTGNNAQTVAANASNLLANKTFSMAKILMSAGLSGDPKTLANAAFGEGVIGAAQWNANLPQMLGTTPLEAGSTSSLSALMSPQTAFIQLRHHIPLGDDMEWSMVGGLINKPMVIAQTNGMGYVKITNPRLDGLTCTQQEKEEIKNLLANGIFT